LKVNIDEFSGFCWGVVRTVDIAEKELKDGEIVYCLGDIIHNPVEIKRLANLGLKTISYSNIHQLKEGSKVLIRAHGEPPSTYTEIFNKKLKLIDATCPVVVKLQERIKKYYLDGYQIVIYGKKDHPEVIGLCGVTDYNAVLILSAEDAEKKVDFTKSTVLFSQTTMDKESFKKITEVLEKKIKNLIIENPEKTAVEFLAKDTICGQVSGRDKKIAEFAKSNDIVFFVAGKNSSNGKVLYNIVNNVNNNCYYIEDETEIDINLIKSVENIGITGATSTPKWLMERIKYYILNLDKKL